MEESGRISTPKQPQLVGKRDWYPYYAGFTEAFVDDVVSSYLESAERLLDPWSGSGTTAAGGAGRAIEGVAVDSTPAPTVLAKARLPPAATGSIPPPLGATWKPTPAGPIWSRGLQPGDGGVCAYGVEGKRR